MQMFPNLVLTALLVFSSPDVHGLSAPTTTTNASYIERKSPILSLGFIHVELSPLQIPIG